MAMPTGATSRIKALRNTLFVGNLPPHLKREEQEAQLRRAFERVAGKGNVTECEVISDDDGASRNFAFVRLQSNAEEAKSKLDNTLITSGGLPIKVRWSLDTATLFVCDLGPDVTEETIRQAFHQFGTVVSCRLEKDPAELGGGSRCRAFGALPSRRMRAHALIHPTPRASATPDAHCPLVACASRILEALDGRKGPAAPFPQPLLARPIAAAGASRICPRRRAR